MGYVMRQKRIGDYLLLIGCGLLVIATSMISRIAAIYLSGVILVGLGAMIDIGSRGAK